MIYKGFYCLDIAVNSSDKVKAKECADIAAILTPLVKCYGSETSALMTAEAIQCLGGVGYTKDYPVEQYMRDSKVLTIWEGTSFIHGKDLVGRKMTMDHGEPFKMWMGSIKDFIDSNMNAAGLQKEMATLEKAYRSAEEVWRTIVSWQANKDEQGELVTLYAIRTLFVFAQLYVAMCLMDQAIVASKTLAGLADDHFDLDFYKGKVASARYYVNNSLPNVFTVSEVIKNADTTVLEVPEEVLIVS